MRFITGLALAATCAFLGAAPAAAGGFGPGGGGYGGAQGYGVGAFGPGNGPVGAYGFRGNPRGPQNVVGFLGGFGGGYGGGGGGDNFIVPGGNTSVNNYYHYDARPRDGGFYGGGGVFYGDNGYSRVYYNRPPLQGDNYCPPEARSYRPAQHVYYLNAAPTRRHVRYLPRY